MSLLVSPPQGCHRCAAVLASYNHIRTRCCSWWCCRFDLRVSRGGRTSMVACRNTSHLIVGRSGLLSSSPRCYSRHAIVEGWTSTASFRTSSTIALTAARTRSRYMFRHSVRNRLVLGRLWCGIWCCSNVCCLGARAFLLRSTCPLEVVRPGCIPSLLVQATSIANHVARRRASP